MKQLWKMLLLLGAVLFGFASCSDDDKAEEPKEAKMLTFGFYQEDNKDLLSTDYEATINGNEISVSLPALIDKSALVARFTLSDNAIAIVEADVQESGVSSNDFSIPVDYFVTNGEINEKYTVTVSKAADGQWSKLAAFTTDSIMECEMKTSPVNNQLYVVYKMNKDESVDEKAAMITYKNDAWDFVGGRSISNGRVTGVTMNFAADGTPYVAYSDYTNTVDGATLQSSSMRKLNGSSWAAVGSEAITNIKSGINAFGFKADGNPIHFTKAEAANTTYGVAKREFIISDFNGSSWTMNGKIPGRDATWAGYLIKTKQVGNTIYVGVLNQTGSNSFSIYKYENNAWTTLIDKYSQKEEAKFNIYDFDMDVDSKGNVYILAADNAPDYASVYKPTLFMYDSEEKEISKIGDQIQENMSTGREFDLAIAPNGTPYVLYRDESKYPTIIYLDSETYQWVEPKTLEAIEADNLTLTISKSGVIYAGYVNTDDCLIVQKFE